MLENIGNIITDDPFKLSAGIKFATDEVLVSRALYEKAQAAHREIAAAYNAQHSMVPIGAVHDAEAAENEAGLRYQRARVSLSGASAKFGKVFLARVAPTSEKLRADVADIAAQLDAAVGPSIAIDDHALAHSLPVTMMVSRARILRDTARRLRELSH